MILIQFSAKLIRTRPASQLYCIEPVVLYNEPSKTCFQLFCLYATACFKELSVIRRHKNIYVTLSHKYYLIDGVQS
jgi:hypothetical protein